MIKEQLSRRTFVKGLGIAAASPWLTNSLYAGSPDTVKKSHAHKILCCNIRVALPEDEKAGFGWNIRKEVCIDVVRSQKPDIICMQEVLAVQNEDLKKAFPKYFSYGFEGPEMDAFKEGYHGIAKNPIFFSTTRYELVAAGQYWLSETPLIAGSLSWGTARARNASWVRLREKRSGTEFRVVNLHLDHQSQLAREKQVSVVLEETAQYQPDFLQILTGDFNAGATNPVYSLVKTAGWQDTYTAIHGDIDPGFTVHGFKGEKNGMKGKGKKIDFIFSKGNISAISADVLKDHKNGRYPSDHYFVSAVVDFN